MFPKCKFNVDDLTDTNISTVFQITLIVMTFEAPKIAAVSKSCHVLAILLSYNH